MDKSENSIERKSAQKSGIRVYETEDLIVHWNANLCIHAGNCWKGLPRVFKPKERPWVTMSAAAPEEIMKTIDTCPTDALKYELPAGSRVNPALAEGSGSIHFNRVTETWSKPAAAAAVSANIPDAAAENPVKIRMMKGGPLLVEGLTQVFDPEGKIIKEGPRMVLCGCGRSNKEPLCDGTHAHKK